jgi:beta-glucuronidase
VEIRFGAVFYKARVFLNGRLVGEHEGGHTAFVVDLTRDLGADNYLAVEVDNRPGLATIPGWAMKLRDGNNVWYDWWHYGGLVRGVSLRLSGPVLVRRQFIRSSGAVTTTRADVTDRVTIERPLPGAPAVRVRATAYDPSGVAVASVERPVPAGAGEVTLTLSIPSPRLWHFDRPDLYTMTAAALDARGATLDERTDTFGLRTVEIRDRGLYLNGERVRLSGITRHEESPWEGLAETRGTIAHDLDALKALQVTLTRPVHYPQHEDVLDYADRHGILLVPEIPIWQFSEAQLADPRVLALAKQMMGEMIAESGNHPSAIGWSTCNESATDTPGGVAYFRAMRDFIKGLDPERFVSYADDRIAHATEPTGVAAHYADFVMWNQYYGSWHGPSADLAPALDRLDRLFPDKMFVISEFGFAGVHAPDAAATDRLRIAVMREQMAEFARRPWIAAAVFWCYQDYLSHRNLSPGRTTGQVDMGLVDEHRQRKPSFDVWRTLNEPARVTLDWHPPAASGGAPRGFRATIARRGDAELPSYALAGYRVRWELRDALGTLVADGVRDLPEMGAPQVVEGSWTPAAPTALTLRLELERPSGATAVERELSWWLSRSGGQDVGTMRLTPP